jgi:peptidoglycan/xylan/chitin deacetylase (PgdA/CDA1 family)
MRSLKASLMAAAFIAVAGAPFAASPARAEGGAVNAAADKAVAETPASSQTTTSAPQQDSAHTQDAAPGKDAAAAPVPDVKQDTKPDVKQDTKQETKPDAKPDGGNDANGNAPAQAQSPAPAQSGVQASASCPGNPNALGTSRVLAIDPADYKRVGRMQYPDSLPLQDKEVVITFDDGPLPPYSNQVLDILASQCVKVTYFIVGEMARNFPAVVRREYEEGHTIGTHSEDHPLHFGELPPDRMRFEIDAGISDVGAALGDTKYLAPFFRIPGLDRSNTLEEELAARHLIIFSADTVADDWRRISPEQIRSLALKRLQSLGKGILLLHDIHAKTVGALPGILKDLKDNGFRVVQVVPSASYEIAMANKPKSQMLASALPGELNLPNGTASTAAKPAWPQPATENSSSEVTALPAPDPSEFQPDSGMTDDTANVQWPEQPPKLTASSEDEGHHAARTSEGRHHKKHGADSDDHPRHHHDAASDEHERHHRHHEHERAGSTRHHADLVTKIKSFAALFTPTH